MKEFAVEDGVAVDRGKLVGSFLDDDVYRKANANLITVCHDVYIEFPNDSNEAGLFF